MGSAISIIIPIDQQRQAQMDNLAHDIVFFVMLMVLIGGVVYLATKKFVLHPLSGLAGAFDEMREGRMDASPDKGDAAREIAGLIDDFDGMAGELRGMYEHLESQVSVRTEELWRANELLEQQRDSLEDLNGELRAANELLERQRDSLEDLNGELEKETRFKSDMLSMVNHELRTPLTSIITFAQVSREACGPDRERDRKAWDHIEKNSQILLTMINDMLDIARSDAGTVHVTREAMDLGDVLAAVRSTMAPLASRYEVDLTTSAAPDVPLVLGDYEKTMRMVENLASNAIKFTPDGGSVGVRVSFDREARIVTIAVSDTGIGIAEEDQGAHFRAVRAGGQHLHAQVRRKRPGLGPGEGVRRAAGLHGRGGKQAGARERLRYHGAEGIDRRGNLMYKIMLVDDEEELRQAIEQLLVSNGYAYVGAKDAAEGLAMLAREKPDLLLLDVMLPGTNGFDLCERIRREGGRVPIIFLSAKNDIVDKSIGFRLGGDDYVTKPFDAAELLLRIDANIRRHKEDLDFSRLHAQKDSVRIGDLEVRFGEYEVRLRGQVVPLTTKEFKSWRAWRPNRARCSPAIRSRSACGAIPTRG